MNSNKDVTPQGVFVIDLSSMHEFDSAKDPSILMIPFMNMTTYASGKSVFAPDSRITLNVLEFCGELNGGTQDTVVRTLKIQLTHPPSYDNGIELHASAVLTDANVLRSLVDSLYALKYGGEYMSYNDGKGSWRSKQVESDPSRTRVAYCDSDRIVTGIGYMFDFAKSNIAGESIHVPEEADA